MVVIFIHTEELRISIEYVHMLSEMPPGSLHAHLLRFWIDIRIIEPLVAAA